MDRIKAAWHCLMGRSVMYKIRWKHIDGVIHMNEAPFFAVDCTDE